MIDWMEIEDVTNRIRQIGNMGIALREAIESSRAFDYESFKDSFALMNELIFEQQSMLEKIINLELENQQGGRKF